MTRQDDAETIRDADARHGVAFDPVVSLVKTGYWGYDSYEEYRNAKLRTAHTSDLVRLFSVSKEEHDENIRRKFIDNGLFLEIAASVRKFLGESPKRGSHGWYFSHPVTVAAMPDDLRDWVSRYHVMQPPIYG